MNETASNIIQVQILNSEDGRPYNLYVRQDRLQAFHNFVFELSFYPEERKTMPIRMPGISWAAMLGLDAIFDRRPKKFPINDILAWLANDPNSTADTMDEIEYALGQFSMLHSPDASGDA